MPSHKVDMAHLLDQFPTAESGIYFSESYWKQSVLKMRLIFFFFWLIDVDLKMCTFQFVRSIHFSGRLHYLPKCFFYLAD